MSAFIVSDQTINRIVSFIDNPNSKNTYIKDEVENLLKKFNMDLNENTEKKLNYLANCLLWLNKKAVDYRYSETNVINLIKYSYTSTSEIQVLKSIHCFLYQCSEGDYPEHRIFKFVEELRDLIESDIIHSLPEYEKAEWD